MNDDQDRTSRRATTSLAWLAQSLETDASLDGRAALLDRAAVPLARGPLGPSLRGREIGHALHPILTDFPLGCWTAAGLLDVVGGRAARPAARRLTALGLLGVVPTVLSGLVEFDALEEQPTRRVATVHAAGNSIAAGCQLLSWRARRRDRHVRGMVWGLAGNTAAAAAGYLGGHLAFARGAGDGSRTSIPTESARIEDTASSDGRGPGSTPVDHQTHLDHGDLTGGRTPLRGMPTEGVAAGAGREAELLDDDQAAFELGVRTDRLDELVEQGLLLPADSEASAGRRFRRADVDAVRLVGG